MDKVNWERHTLEGLAEEVDLIKALLLAAAKVG
jgi:hypothetical protein